MSDAATSITVRTLEELAPQLSLTGIHTYKVSAELEETEKAPAPPPNAVESPALYDVRIHHDGTLLGVRIRVRIGAQQGTVIADIAAEYNAAQPLNISQDLAFEFANNIALMVLIPYLREAVQSMSARIFSVPILLPMVQRGQLAFTPNATQPS